MSENNDLRRRLLRLGVTRGTTKKPSQKQVKSGDIDTLIPDGTIEETGDGSCFLITRIYPAETTHGPLQIGRWLTLDPVVLARIGDNDDLEYVDPRQYVFFDTETTGLGGGAFAFQVGIGFFNEDDDFEIRQYFLRDPAEEPAMLSLLTQHLATDKGMVTFNGRTFDVPLMASRYIMNRKPTMLASLPNLDLLHPARRLWRRRHGSCALGSLESTVLNLKRSQQDVPGSLIPYLYREYLQTRNARDMLRVLYHNEIDLLSMVSLGVLLAQSFSSPERSGIPVDDRLSLAKWYSSRGMAEEAETAFRTAAEEAPDAENRYDALVGLAYLLKRADRREEAITSWEFIADLKFDTLGHVELAKHYEWHEIDLHEALKWTENAAALAESWRPGLRRSEALREINHRRERLLRKLNGQDTV